MPEGDTSIPLELQALVGKEFVYKLKLNKYNLIEGLQDYGVSTVFTPIEELEDAYVKHRLLLILRALPLALHQSVAVNVRGSCPLLLKLLKLSRKATMAPLSPDAPDQCGKAAIGAKYWFEEKKTGSGSRFHLIMNSDFGYVPMQHVGNSEATIAI
ncbi:uncharacterized protein LOC141724093 isoform X2 [Apium graveolens]